MGQCNVLSQHMMTIRFKRQCMQLYHVKNKMHVDHPILAHFIAELPDECHVVHYAVTLTGHRIIIRAGKSGNLGITLMLRSGDVQVLTYLLADFVDDTPIIRISDRARNIKNPEQLNKILRNILGI